MARMWASVNDPRSGEPRCPLVPKLTRWPRSSRSGRRSKYSRSSRTRSTSSSLGAGSPARGEIVIGSFSSGHRTWFRIPDLGGVLGDRAIARKLAGTGHVQDSLARPRVVVRVKLAEPLVRIEIGFEVRQMHVVVPLRQQCIRQRGKDPGLVSAEIIRGDQV